MLASGEGRGGVEKKFPDIKKKGQNIFSGNKPVKLRD
jgi:hypothetical protein